MKSWGNVNVSKRLKCGDDSGQTELPTYQYKTNEGLNNLYVKLYADLNRPPLH